MLVSKVFSLQAIVAISIIYHSSLQIPSFHLIFNTHHHQVPVIQFLHHLGSTISKDDFSLVQLVTEYTTMSKIESIFVLSGTNP